MESGSSLVSVRAGSGGRELPSLWARASVCAVQYTQHLLWDHCIHCSPTRRQAVLKSTQLEEWHGQCDHRDPHRERMSHIRLELAAQLEDEGGATSMLAGNSERQAAPAAELGPLFWGT